MAKKKIIRLTESELVRLVEKVVKESKNLYGDGDGGKFRARTRKP